MASAATFNVDDAGDGADQTPGDGICSTASNVCTLRAALMEANANTGADTIGFNGVTSIMSPTLVDVVDTVTIDGALNGNPDQRIDLNGGGTAGGFRFSQSAEGSMIQNVVIRNMLGNGITLSGQGYTVTNAWVGVTPDGLNASPNSGDGISISRPLVVPALPVSLPPSLDSIGDTIQWMLAAFPAVLPNIIEGNVLSGNDGDGIEIHGAATALNIVSNNRIGTNPTATASIPNGTGAGGDGHGVVLSANAFANIIGPGNVISGNDSDPNSSGVFVDTSAVKFPNLIVGNVVGLGANPLDNLGNSRSGIRAESVWPDNNAPANPVNLSLLIGPGNVIGHNKGGFTDLDNFNDNDGGIAIGGNGQRVRIFGNLIGGGEFPAGSGSIVDFGNAADGINVAGPDHEVGGVLPFEANVIFANNRHGITIRGSATHSVSVLNNIIGRDPLNLIDLPNAGDGIYIHSASSNSIGDGSAAGGNIIAGNLRNGVKIKNGSSTSGWANLITHNSIFGNAAGGTGVAIDLEYAPQAADPVDDTPTQDPNTNYTNYGQNAPVICGGANAPATCGAADGPIYGAGNTTVNWALRSAPNTDYVIEFFASAAAGSGGTGEGQTHLGAVNVTTDAVGNASGTSMVTGGAGGQYVSATATAVNITDPPGPANNAPANNTSEFSNAVVTQSPGELRFTLADYNAGEGMGMVTIDVERVNGSQGAVGVSFATADGSAQQGADYQATSGTLQWADGDAGVKSFTVPVMDDQMDEPDETVQLSLSNATGGADIVTPGMATITIADNDGQPLLSVDDASVLEGDAGTTALPFTVSLSAPSAFQVTVDYITGNGTATTGDNDYDMAVGQLTFMPGETSKTVNVIVNGDTAVEPDEQFQLTIGSPINASLLDNTGIGTILDDDDVPQPRFSIDDISMNEGDAGANIFVFTVTRSNSLDGVVTVEAQTVDGTATSASGDFIAAAATLTFADQVATQQFPVVVNGDTSFEQDETFSVVLSMPSAGTVIDGTGVGTVINDDGQVSLSVADVTSAEGDAGGNLVTFTVTLSSASNDPVTVEASTADGTATAGSDYTALMPLTLTILPGALQNTFTVEVLGDTVSEPDETFLVNLANPVNATIGVGQAVGTITDDDGLTVSIADVSQAEGDAGTMAFGFAVSLSMASNDTVTVDVGTSNGTAIAGSDYTALPMTTVTFAPGELQKTVDVAVIGDTDIEQDETFFVELSNATNAAIGTAQAIGTIINDDGQLTGLSVSDVALMEGDSGTTAFVFNVTLNPVSVDTVTVDIASADGTAKSGSDYTQLPTTTLTFMPGETVKSVTVDVLGDTDKEPSETFFVNLSNATVASIAKEQGVGTIKDDDGAVAVPLLSHWVLMIVAAMLSLLAATGTPRRRCK